MKSLFFQTVGSCVSAVLLAALAACGEPSETPFEVQLVTSPPAQSGTCPDEGVGGLDKPSITAVRLTFYDADADPADPNRGFLCDRLVAGDESGSVFYLETPKDTRLHIVAEAFGEPAIPGDATPLVASGRLDDVPFTNGGEVPRIFMALTGRMSCSLGALNKARAFHAMTALPGGRAIVTGGLVATTGAVTAVAEGSGLLLTDEIEIYDARTGRFVYPTLAGEDGVPRAFHQSFLVAGSTAESAQILLLGGVAQGTVPLGNGVVKIRTGPEHPFRLTPVPEAAPAPAMLLTIDLTQDPPLVTRSSVDLDGWPAAYFQAGAVYSDYGACVVGGAQSISAAGEFVTTTAIDLGYPDSGEHYPLTGDLAVPRIGHTVTMNPDGATGLVWGGNLGQASPASSVAERLTVSPAPPTTAVMTRDASATGSATAIPTAFHTATPLPDGDVLVVGGFVLETSLALNPSPTLPLVRVRTQGLQYEIYGQDSSGFTPVGYHAAVALPDGRVMITGGSPTFEPGSTPCPGGENAWTCSMGQALIYTPGATAEDGGLLSPLPVGELQVPRFGHGMVLLDNHTVLVVGGLRRDGSTLYTEPSAELINMATGAASGDAPLNRLPGAVYSAETVCPVY